MFRAVFRMHLKILPAMFILLKALHIREICLSQQQLTLLSSTVQLKVMNPFLQMFLKLHLFLYLILKKMDSLKLAIFSPAMKVLTLCTYFPTVLKVS